MLPFFKPKDLILFKKYLKGKKYYFEFGSGGSTFYAAHQKNIKKIYSVESDKSWIEQILNNIEDSVAKSKIAFLELNLPVKPHGWGYPIGNAKRWPDYSNAITQIGDDVKNLDIVLIDGRFRVACALKIHNLIRDDCIVLFDDFMNRPFYHVVLDYYEIIKHTPNKHMAVLKKRPDTSPPLELIKKYQVNPD